MGYFCRSIGVCLSAALAVAACGAVLAVIAGCRQDAAAVATRPAASVSTEPATQPAPLSKENLILLQKLESNDSQQRQIAEEALPDLGDNADEGEQIVRAMMLRSTSFETTTRLNWALARIAKRRRFELSPITLHMHNATVEAVYGELFRQADWPMKTDPANLMKWAFHQRITVDADGRPFWEVFDHLETLTNLGFENHGRQTCLCRQPPEMRAPRAISGAFLIVPTEIGVGNQAASYIETGTRDAPFALEMLLFPEPKLTVVEVTDDVKVLQAVDEHGNSLMVPDPPGGGHNLYPAGGTFSGLNANLKFAHRNPGTHLARFRGSIAVLIQTATEHVEIADLMNAPAKSIQIGDMTLAFEGCKDSPDGCRVTMSVPHDSQNKWLPIFDSFQSSMHLLSADGRQLSERGIGGEEKGDREVFYESVADIDTTGKPAGHPAKLIWDVPTQTKKIEVPIEFDDIDLKTLAR